MKHQEPGKAGRTRRYIVETTAPIFNKQGYAGTSFSDLIAATSLSKGSFYGNFSNKDELALEAFRYNVSQIREPLRAMVQAAATPEGKLRAYVSFYRRLYRTNLSGNGGCPVLNTATEADDTHPQLREEVQGVIRELLSAIERHVKNGMAQGAFNKATNARSFAIQFLAQLEGGMMLAHAMNDSRILDATLDRMSESIDALLT